MGYMLPTLLLFLSIGIILTLTGLMLGIIAVFYRSRESIVRALGILLLGLALLSAYQFQDNVVGNLQEFGYDLDAIQSLEIPKLSAVKGAPTGITSGAWVDYQIYITLTQFLIALSIMSIGYLGVQVIGIEGSKKMILMAVAVLLPLLGLALSLASANMIIEGETDTGVRYRDISNIIKGIAIIYAIGLTTLGLVKLYRDVEERAYIVQAAGWGVLLIGLLLLGYMTLTSWERFAISEIQEGDLGSVINTFRTVSALLLIGSLLLLTGSLLEIVPVGAAGEGEEIEATEEAEEEVSE
ncbi:MAG: hypothetical protein F7C08_00590 [Desulfurococcales archaeon]|nr:hypothetical protein [Desulfurococcales archaeon]